MSTGALENKSQQKSGRAIALPAPPPPRSLTFWKDCYQWIMQNTSKVEKFNLSEALLFGLINDAKDLLLHHLLHISRNYIYICKQRDTRPNVLMYIQIVQLWK